MVTESIKDGVTLITKFILTFDILDCTRYWDYFDSHLVSIHYHVTIDCDKENDDQRTKARDRGVGG